MLDSFGQPLNNTIVFQTHRQNHQWEYRNNCRIGKTADGLFWSGQIQKNQRNDQQKRNLVNLKKFSHKKNDNNRQNNEYQNYWSFHKVAVILTNIK